MDSGRNLDFLALFNSLLVMADADQPTAVPLLEEFFFIGLFTRIRREKARGRGAQQWRTERGSARKEEEEVAVAEKHRQGNK
jgi:hypothetical protein